MSDREQLERIAKEMRAMVESLGIPLAFVRPSGRQVSPYVPHFDLILSAEITPEHVERQLRMLKPRAEGQP